MKMKPDDNTRSYAAITAGTIISHYRIIEKIGAGAAGAYHQGKENIIPGNRISK